MGLVPAIRPEEGHLLAMLPEEKDMGPALKAIPDRWKVFVIACANMGVKVDHTRAARAAGYPGTKERLKVQGWRLAHNPKVMAAMQEVARARVQAGTLDASALMLKVVQDPKAATKDRLRAAQDIMDRGGLHVMTEHKVTVAPQEDRVAKLQRLVNLAKSLGQDPRALLGNLADVVEADFKVLEPAADGVLEPRG